MNDVMGFTALMLRGMAKDWRCWAWMGLLVASGFFAGAVALIPALAAGVALLMLGAHFGARVTLTALDDMIREDRDGAR